MARAERLGTSLRQTPKSMPNGGAACHLLLLGGGRRIASWIPGDSTEAAQSLNAAWEIGACFFWGESGMRSELTARNQARRRCRLCDPVSGRCRRLCVRRPDPKPSQEIAPALPAMKRASQTA